MEVLTPVGVGALFAAGMYLILRRNVFSVFVGVVIVTHAVNLLLFTSGGLSIGEPPLLPNDDVPARELSDPVPQALILTSIVIGLGVQSFLLVLVFRVIRLFGGPDVDVVRNNEPGEPSGGER